MKHAENDNALSHSTWKETKQRNGEKESQRSTPESSFKKGAGAGFEWLPGCTLSFGSILTVSAFYPSSPASLRSSLGSAVCSFPRAPLTPGVNMSHEMREFKRKLFIWQASKVLNNNNSDRSYSAWKHSKNAFLQVANGFRSLRQMDIENQVIEAWHRTVQKF